VFVDLVRMKSIKGIVVVVVVVVIVIAAAALVIAIAVLQVVVLTPVEEFKHLKKIKRSRCAI
jgi:hypothetical protein